MSATDNMMAKIVFNKVYVKAYNTINTLLLLLLLYFFHRASKIGLESFGGGYTG